MNPAAVDEEGFGRDVRGAVAREEDDGVPEVVGCGEPVEGSLGGARPFRLGVVVVRCEAGVSGETGLDGVHADLRAQDLAERVRHRADAALRRAVEGRPGSSNPRSAPVLETLMMVPEPFSTMRSPATRQPK